MSRVGKKPITIPEGVEVNIDNNLVKVKGPKGELQTEINPDITVDQEDGQLLVKRPTDNRPHRAMHGLYRALINNMVVGVTEGFRKVLEVAGVGFRAQMQGNKLQLNVGYSHPVEMELPEGVNVEVEKNARIIITGIDKEKVGQFAAKVRAVREPEPYKGKGIKYEEETIIRKEGKAAGK